MISQLVEKAYCFFLKPRFRYFPNIPNDLIIHISTYLLLKDSLDLRHTCKKSNRILHRIILQRRCVTWMKFLVSPNITKYPGARNVMMQRYPKKYDTHLHAVSYSPIIQHGGILI